jgi:hypothetical protein
MNRFKFLIVGIVSFLIVSQGNAQNAAVTCPANMVVSATNGQEGTVVNFPALTGELAGASYAPASGSFFRMGSHSVILTTASGQKCSFTVMVTDNESPTLSPITLSRSTLWPASGKLKKVVVNYDVSDNSGTVKTTLAVTSNTTDGVKDFEIVDDHLLRLKASRLPYDFPRVYTITVTATDDAGNKTTRTTSISVSRTMTAIPASN